MSVYWCTCFYLSTCLFSLCVHLSMDLFVRKLILPVIRSSICLSLVYSSAYTLPYYSIYLFATRLPTWLSIRSLNLLSMRLFISLSKRPLTHPPALLHLVLCLSVCVSFSYLFTHLSIISLANCPIICAPTCSFTRQRILCFLQNRWGLFDKSSLRFTQYSSATRAAYLFAKPIFSSTAATFTLSSILLLL